MGPIFMIFGVNQLSVKIKLTFIHAHNDTILCPAKLNP